MEIIVIGSGLAGLTAAIALVKAGHQVRVLESAPQITYIGAGIQLSPNASRVLVELGVDTYIARYCTEPIDLRMMRWQTGQVLSDCSLRELAVPNYGSRYWHIHRADLHRGLLECAEALGVKSFYGQRVIAINPMEPSATTYIGRVWHADLIIAADGLHSICRSIVLQRQSPPVPTGQMAYRVTLPAAQLIGIPELEEFATVPRNNHWIGPHGTVLSYLLEGVDERLVNFVFTCNVELGTLPEGVDQKPGTSDEVRKAFAGWDSRIDKMLNFLPAVLEWRLYTHEHVHSWVHPSSRLCLIGDSAHAMTPYLAQGAAMGIEDAAVIGGLLEAYPQKTDLSNALHRYEKLRIPRVHKIAEASISSRWFTQMEDGQDQQRRDEYLLSHPGIWPDHINIRSRKEFLDELFGYDAYAALAAELDSQASADKETNLAGAEKFSHRESFNRLQ